MSRQQRMTPTRSLPPRHPDGVGASGVGASPNPPVDEFIRLFNAAAPPALLHALCRPPGRISERRYSPEVVPAIRTSNDIRKEVRKCTKYVRTQSIDAARLRTCSVTS
eukprot:268988-Prorocentrum_minimum.AAC.4